MTETRPKDAHVWERDPHDWYCEPGRCTDQLLSVESFPGWTHDPCCGAGNIVGRFLAAGHMATGSDLVQRINAPWHLGVSDFLAADTLGAFGAQNVCFNPPFYRAIGAEDCIRRALTLAPGKVAAFVEKRFTGGAGRAKGLFYDHPPSRLWEITPRPSCPPGAFLAAGGRASGGTMDYVWLVWDAERSPPGSPYVGAWLK